MAEFRTGYLLEDREEVTHLELLAMTQNDCVFWCFDVQVQNKNSLLHDTSSFLNEDVPCDCIESALDAKLAMHLPT